MGCFVLFSMSGSNFFELDFFCIMKIYIAIPYSGQEEKSFYTANKIASELMKKGHLVISPISHSHPIAQYGLPGNWSFWKKQDEWIMKNCDTLLVVDNDIEAVEKSHGVQEEIKFAEKNNIQIIYYSDIK